MSSGPDLHLIPREFYLNDDVVALARSLIGCVLHTRKGQESTSGLIVETEAYRGRDDKGCHAFIHGATSRTKTMFEAGGCAYVYICYGMHHMVNVVTNRAGQGDAVLIRAIQPLEGLDLMKQRRNMDFEDYRLSGGPGKVCRCLGIDKADDGQKYYDPKATVQLLRPSDSGGPWDICSGPRVGMSKRVADYSNKPWRFYIKNNPFVSRPLKVWYPYG